MQSVSGDKDASWAICCKSVDMYDGTGAGDAVHGPGLSFALSLLASSAQLPTDFPTSANAGADLTSPLETPSRGTNTIKHNQQGRTL